MPIFRIALSIMGIGLAAYTSLVIANHGWNFTTYYFADLARIGWPGQFNLDFTILIVLAAAWIVWRNHGSPSSIVLALLLVPFVSMLLTAYLLYLSWQERGDMSRILIGDRVRRSQ